MPCSHKFCRKCIEEWKKQRGAGKACPLCRNPLPPGPEKLLDLGYGMFMKIKGAVDRSRPGVDPQTPWPALVGDQKRGMDQAVVMLREAADQGHMDAQAVCADIYEFGRGVAQDDRLAFVYTEKAAQQGGPQCENNTGVRCRDGLGCEQSYARAAEWYEKAAGQGQSDAMTNLGILFYSGHGVPQSYARAAELFRQSAAKGNSQGQHNLAVS